MVKGAASQVLQVPPLKSGVYLGYSVCFDVYVMMQITYIQTTGNSKTEGCRVRQKSKWSTRGGEFIQIVVWKGKYTGYLNFVK